MASCVPHLSGTRGGVVKYDTTGKILATYTTADGLISNSLCEVAVDCTGVVWFGTTDGITTFDGESWDIYEITDSLDGSGINSIEVGHNGDVWIGTSFRTFSFDGKQWYEHGTSAIDIEICDNDSVWIVPLYSKSLLMFYDDTWTTYDTTNSEMPSNYVRTVAADSGGIWIGLRKTNRDSYISGGVLYFDGETWTPYDTSNTELSGNNVYRIEVSPDDTKWILTSSGFTSYNGKEWKTYDSKETGIDGYSAISITFGLGSIPVFGYYPRGIYKMTDTTWYAYPLSADLPSGYVKCVAVEQDNTKWFGTNRGAVKYDKGQWTSYPASETSLRAGDVWSIAIDKDNVKWFGEDIHGRAISSFDGNTWKNYNMWGKKEWVTHYVEAIAVDCTNVKWFGSDNTIWPAAETFWGSGANSFDGQTWTRYDTSNSGLAHNKIKCIMVDPDNTKWFGTHEGLSTYNGSEWTTYDTSNSGLCGGPVKDMAYDSKGLVWIGARKGLCSFDGSRWKSYLEKGGISPSDYILAVTVKDDGTTLIGTQYNGLKILQDSTWTTYTESDGLPDNTVNDITIDKKGTVWICTNEGISRFGGPPVIELDHPNFRSSGAKEVSILHIGPSLVLSYKLSKPTQVAIDLYNIQGRCVGSVKRHNTAGRHTQTWDIKDLPSGGYVVRTRSGQFDACKTIVKQR